MSAHDERLDALARYAAGCATPDDVARLETAVRADAEFRAYVIEYLHLDAALEECAAMLAVAAPAPGKIIRWIMPAPVWRLAAAAAIVLLAGAAWWWAGRAPAGVELEVVAVREAAGFRAGERRSARELRIDSGTLEVRLASGVELTLSGPCAMTFSDAMHARLLRGQVTADVGPRGKGFILDTPQARVVDLGTRFGVVARDSGEARTDVVVFEGKVEVFATDAAPASDPLARLAQGQAVTVHATRRLERLASLQAGEGAANWSTRPDAESCLAQVTDNAARTEDWFFYRIHPRGLKPGAAAYLERENTWDAPAGGEFPAALVGADYVQMPRAAGKGRQLELRVTVARPAELFVLVPAGAATPEWLSRDFTRTADALALRKHPQQPQLALAVAAWRRVVAEPGVVTLGAPRADTGEQPSAMYGVAARPLP